ncbi:MAG: M48 family metallopeptidase [Candidatus Saccharibacteria bacterium]|nr:M48 family metallopeptidase [Candidatus Saccharibacteria bacterium]
MYSSIAANKRNTILIMLVFVFVIAGLGWGISLYYGEPSLLYYVAIGALIYATIQYFIASKIALAVTGAKAIEKKDNPRLYRIVENLSIATGLPTPKIYIIDDPAPNAFATGRDPRHASVAATAGLLDIMDDRELEAVMAHEMGHVQNYDIRVSMIVFGLVAAIGLISDVVLRMMIFGDDDRDNVSPVFIVIGIVAIILAPIVAFLIQAAVSRQREYLADATGALTTRYPEGLASALEKLRGHSQPMQRQNGSTAHLFFSNPMKPGFFGNLFSTHPPLDDRIKRLRENEGKM